MEMTIEAKRHKLPYEEDDEDLVRAAYNGDFSKVKELIENGVNPDIIEIVPILGDNHENLPATALMSACVYDNRDIIDFLLKNGADINVITETTEQWLNTFYKQKSVWWRIILFCCFPFCRKRYTFRSCTRIGNALAFALLNENVDLAVYLLKKGADPYSHTNLYRENNAHGTPVRQAYVKNMVDVLKALHDVCDVQLLYEIDVLYKYFYKSSSYPRLKENYFDEKAKEVYKYLKTL